MTSVSGGLGLPIGLRNSSQTPLSEGGHRRKRCPGSRPTGAETQASCYRCTAVVVAVFRTCVASRREGMREQERGKPCRCIYTFIQTSRFSDGDTACSTCQTRRMFREGIRHQVLRFFRQNARPHAPTGALTIAQTGKSRHIERGSETRKRGNVKLYYNTRPNVRTRTSTPQLLSYKSNAVDSKQSRMRSRPN